MTSKSPADQASVDAYAAFAGSEIDTGRLGAGSIAFRVSEAGGANGITAKVQASIDGSTYVDLVAYDETGTAHASADVAIAASGAKWLIIAREAANGAKAAFRYYRVALKSTVGSSAGTGHLRGFAR